MDLKYQIDLHVHSSRYAYELAMLTFLAIIKCWIIAYPTCIKIKIEK